MKKQILLCLILMALSWPVMGEEITVISEMVAKGNGTVVTDVQTTEVDLHSSFVALTPQGMVYTSQVNGKNASINATDAISLKLDSGLKSMKTTIEPLRDPFKIKVPAGFER